MSIFVQTIKLQYYWEWGGGRGFSNIMRDCHMFVASTEINIWTIYNYSHDIIMRVIQLREILNIFFQGISNVLKTIVTDPHCIIAL